jgi:hypothetical protein
MSKNIILVLVYHRHKLLDLIKQTFKKRRQLYIMELESSCTPS